MSKYSKPDNKGIGQRIRQEREKMGLSREEFAEIISLSDYYVGQLERGERQMSLPVLVKVSSCLHVSLDYLVWGNATEENTCLRDPGRSYAICSNSLDEELQQLLQKCSSKEIELFKKLVKTLLPYLEKRND